MHYRLAGLGAALALVLMSPTATALQAVDGTENDDYIYIGIADPPSDARIIDLTGTDPSPRGWGNYVCVMHSWFEPATWYFIGNAFLGVADNLIVHGHGGHDLIRVLDGRVRLSSDHPCAGDAYWMAPTMSGTYIDLHGGDGHDRLYGSSYDSWLHGGEGEDRLHVRCDGGRAYGGPGADAIFSYGTYDEQLDGGPGDHDCVDDANGDYHTMSGGSGVDDVFVGSGTCPAGFELQLTAGGCDDEFPLPEPC